jgi:hypothetical protein
MKALTPVKAIRAKCSECAGSSRAAPRCEKEDCPLYPFRTGHNPARVGIGGGDRCGNGRFSQKRATQVAGFVDKKRDPHGSTPETLLGHPRAEFGQVDFSAMSPRERRRIKESALAILFPARKPRSDTRGRRLIRGKE